METLRIKIERKPNKCHDITVEIPPLGFQGCNFCDGERHFVSSDSFVLSSANYRVQAAVRTAHFTFPDKPLKAKARITDAPKDRWYIEFLTKAVQEFNEKMIYAGVEKHIELVL